MKVCQFEDLGRSRITEKQLLAELSHQFKIRLRIFLFIYAFYVSFPIRFNDVNVYQRQ